MFGLFRKKDMTVIFNATDNLARNTCSMGMYLVLKQKDSFLNYSELTRLDSVIFSAYLNQLLILSYAKNKDLAHQVINRYFSFVKQILEEDGGCFDYDFPSETVTEMMVNRISFYKSIFQSKPNVKMALNAIVEEFEYIIKSDIINGEYKPFSASSPLPILGFEKDFACQIEARKYPAFTNEMLKESLSNLLRLIK